MEFLLLVAFSSLIFIIFFAALQDRIVTANKEQASEDINRIGRLVYSEIVLAKRFGDGYERNFFVPYDINGLQYKAIITNEKILLINSSVAKNYFFFDHPVRGELRKGENTIFHVAGITFLNQNLTEALRIKIDGSSSDWDSLKQWYGVAELQDEALDAYIPTGNPNTDYDLKDFMIWNDAEWLYFKFSLHDPTIEAYQAPADISNTADFILFLDTDVNSSSGYHNTNPLQLVSMIGADYAIFDPYLNVMNTKTWVSYQGTPVNRTSENPFSFDGSDQNRWGWSKYTGATGFTYHFAYLGTYGMEAALKLNTLPINVIDEPVIAYSFIAIENGTKITDYIPGKGDSIIAGYYQIQNR